MIGKIIYVVSKLLKKGLNIPAIKNCKIHKSSRVCVGSHIVSSIIGKYSYVGDYSEVVNVSIGCFCSIGGNCVIGGLGHPIDWVSSSPVFHEGKNVMRKNFSNHRFETSKKTTIENDVWIGSNCLIKSGVTIGDGAIIGMGSVVTKDVEPYSIVGGNPAKLIRKRFTNEVIEKLKELKWWNFEEEKIFLLAQTFNDIESFLTKNIKEDITIKGDL